MAIDTKNKKTSKTTKVFIAITAVFLALVIGFFGYNLLRDRFGIGDVAFTINGKSYSKSDLQKQFDDPKNGGLAKKQIFESYLELEKQKYVLDKLKVAVSDVDIKNSEKKLFPSDSSNLNINQRLLAYANARQIALQNVYSGDYSGGILVFPYTRKLEQSAKGRELGWGDPKLIEEDKKYALDKANYYKDKLAKKEISLAKAVEEIRNDPKLRYYNAQNDSTEFGNSGDNPFGSWNLKISNISIANYVKDQDKTGVKDIQTFQTQLGTSDESSDAGYFFVDLSKVLKANEKIFEQYDKELNNLKVKVYVNY